MALKTLYTLIDDIEEYFNTANPLIKKLKQRRDIINSVYDNMDEMYILIFNVGICLKSVHQ